MAVLVIIIPLLFFAVLGGLALALFRWLPPLPAPSRPRPRGVAAGLFPALAQMVFIVFSIVPFGPTICPAQLGEVMSDKFLAQCASAPGQSVALQVAHLDVGLLFYFAIASLAVYGTTLAGWASYNKWSLLGGLRAS